MRYNIGNAQTIGEMEFQSNYFATAEKPNLVAAAADGGIDHINGRKAAVIAVEQMMGALAGGILNREHFCEIFKSASSKIIQNINDYIYGGKTPNLSLSVICVSDGRAYFYTVGSIRIYVYDDKNIRDINGLGFHNVYDIKAADNFMMISQGGYEALTPMELLQFLRREDDKYRRSDNRAYDKAVGLIEEINKKNIKNAKNSTIVLFEGNV